jgi:8-oxo-dGTP pyrophosphatase MutT (NUDIX family)
MTLDELRTLAVARLDPVDRWDPAGVADHSDFDLNPAMRPAAPGALKAAAVLIPVIQRAGGLHLILTRRSDRLASHTGQIAFPGGRLDAGETPVQAALREAWEEIALAPAGVEPLGLSSCYETVTGYVVTPVLAAVDPAGTYVASPDEVAEVFEAPFDFVMDSANHQRRFYEAPDGARRWFYAVPYGERFIWGATAGMLRTLSQRLFGETAPVMRTA